MYPSLYHFFYEVLGVEWTFLKIVNSFGFFVALAFIAASYCQGLELKRKREQGLLKVNKKKVWKGKNLNYTNYIFNIIIGFLIGFKFVYLILNTAEATKDAPAFFLSGTGSWWGGLMVAAIFGYLGYRDLQKEKKKYPKPVEVEMKILPESLSGNITMVAAIFGIAGAKLFHLLENPAELVDFFTTFSADNFLSGLTVYGGLIIGGAAVLYYMHRNGINPLHGADANAPGFLLAYGIGRIGCHVSGDGDWGIANSNPKPLSWIPDWMWSYNYPNNVLGVRGARDGGYVGKNITEDMGWPIFENYGTYLDPGVFPTPFYEAVFGILAFAILWKLRRRFTSPGVLFCTFLVINGIERFWIEKIRVNNKLDFLGIEVTQAEIISVVLVLLGIAGILYFKRKAQLKTAT